jgi:hypothetical protein
VSAAAFSGKRIDYPLWHQNMALKTAPKEESEAIKASALDL